VGALTLVSMLVTTKIRLNLHTGQYASSVTSDHSQGQALVEPLVGVAIDIFVCDLYIRLAVARSRVLQSFSLWDACQLFC